MLIEEQLAWTQKDEHKPSDEEQQGDELERGGLVRSLAAAPVVKVHLVVAV